MIRPVQLMIVLFCGGLVVQAFAQDNPGAQSEDEERRCIPASEAEQSSSGESGPSQEDAGNEGGTGLPICEEAEPPDGAEPPAPEDVNDDTGAGEADPAQEFEVSPEDEISEDYPVPLPSDI